MQLKELNLTNELRMLKTALIYGDKVDIRSVASSIIFWNIMLLALPREEIYETYLEDTEEILNDAREYLEYEGVREFIKIYADHPDIVEFSLFGAEGWGPELELPNPDLEQAMIFDFMVQVSEEILSGETIPFFDEAAGF